MMRALLVEDDPIIRGMISRVLSRHGFRCDEASDGAEGIDRLSSETYDLVVLDLMMPRVNGFSLLSYVAEKKSETLKRVVVITAMSEAAVQKYLPAPICRIIAKPFDIDVLVSYALECARAA